MVILPFGPGGEWCVVTESLSGQTTSGVTGSRRQEGRVYDLRAETINANYIKVTKCFSLYFG